MLSPIQHKGLSKCHGSCRARWYIAIIPHHEMILDVILVFGYWYIIMWHYVLSFPGFKGCITIKSRHFLNLTDCSCCPVICFYPLSHHIHIIYKMFWESTKYCGDVELFGQKYWSTPTCRRSKTYMITTGSFSHISQAYNMYPGIRFL